MSDSAIHARLGLDPFNELNRLRNLRFGRFNRSFVAPSEGLPKASFSQAQVSSSADHSWTPAVDIIADDTSYKISVEIPGVKREDVSVEFHERVLTIQGTRERPSGESEEDFFHLERHFGSFERKFRLPEDSVQDDIKAVYRDGILTIDIPKIEARKPMNVAIQA